MLVPYRIGIGTREDKKQGSYQTKKNLYIPYIFHSFCIVLANSDNEYLYMQVYRSAA